VSPHVDDAALSCAGLLDRGEPLDILIVFAGTPATGRSGWWDRRSGFFQAHEAMDVRLREDPLALSGTDHRRTYLKLLDAQYLRGERGAADSSALRESVAAWLRATGNGTVAVPAGAGRTPRFLERARSLRRPFLAHPDHAFVRDTVCELARESDAELIVYEELPYLLAEPADREVERLAERLGRHADPLTLSVDAHCKTTRIKAYASQLRLLERHGLNLSEPSAIPTVERYWLLPP
jgi:hypothetical protein